MKVTRETRELRERRYKLVQDNGELLERLKGQTDAARIKEMTDEWDKRDADIVALNKQIDRIERQAEHDADANAPIFQRRSGRGEHVRDADPAADEKSPILFRNAQTGELVRGVRGEQRMADVYPHIASRAHGRIGDLVGSIVRGRAISPEIEDEFRTMSTTGGYSIPEPYSLQFIDLARAGSVLMKAGVSTIDLQGQTLKLAKITADPTAAWKTENNAFTASDVTLDAVLLTPRVLGVLIKMSEELAMDSPNIGQIIEAAISGSMGVKLDAAGLVGSGVAPEPGGIMKSGTTANTDVQTLSVGGTPTSYAFFSQMVQKVRLANFEPNAAIWNPRDLGTLERLTDTTGQPKLPPKSFNDVMHLSTTGIPITVEGGGSPNDGSIAIVGKFSEMVFAPRMQVTILASRESNDGTDSAMAKFQIHIRAVMRADFGIFRGAAFCVGTGIND